MNLDIYAIFSISDAKYQTKHTFSVQLGIFSNKRLEKEINKAFKKCKFDHRLEIVFDGSDDSEFELERYETPFHLSDLYYDYYEVNEALININYYSKKNRKVLKQLHKESKSFWKMHDILLEKKS
jgi:hypothetical protein